MTSDVEYYQSPLYDVVNDLLTKSNISLLLHGEVGTNKTFIGRSLTNAKYVTSLELKTNFLEKFIQNYRKCIEVEIFEIYEVIEGEVVELADDLVLKTMDMVSSFKIGDKMMTRMKRDGLSVGDIVRINKTTGKFRIVEGGRIETGELCKRIEEAERATLHCMDMVNSKINPLDDCDVSIDQEIRREVDESVLKMIKEGKANFKIKKLVIDDAQVLSEEEIAYIQTYSSAISEIPILIISETDLNFDCLKIKSKKNEIYEIKKILNLIRSKYEIEFEENAFEKIVEVADKISLKYATSLIPFFKRGDGAIQLNILENFLDLFKSCC